MLTAFRTVLTQLLASEKAVMSITVLTCGTVLTALGHLPWSEWSLFASGVLGLYTVGKTAQGIAAVRAAATAAASNQDRAVLGALLSAEVSDAAQTTKRVPPSA